MMDDNETPIAVVEGEILKRSLTNWSRSPVNVESLLMPSFNSCQDPNSLNETYQKVNLEKFNGLAPNKETYKCGICHQIMLTKQALKHHRDSVHNDRKTFRCTYANCLRAFTSQNYLKNHIDIEHSDCSEAQIPCPKKDCGMLFPNNYRLKRHVRQDHKQEKLFQCNVCDRKFSTLEVKNNHQKTKHGSTSSSNNSLNFNRKILTPDQFYRMDQSKESENDTIYASSPMSSRMGSENLYPDEVMLPIPQHNNISNNSNGPTCIQQPQFLRNNSSASTNNNSQATMLCKDSTTTTTNHQLNHNKAAYNNQATTSNSNSAWRTKSNDSNAPLSKQIDRILHDIFSDNYQEKTTSPLSSNELAIAIVSLDASQAKSATNTSLEHHNNNNNNIAKLQQHSPNRPSNNSGAGINNNSGGFGNSYRNSYNNINNTTTKHNNKHNYKQSPFGLIQNGNGTSHSSNGGGGGSHGYAQSNTESESHSTESHKSFILNASSSQMDDYSDGLSLDSHMKDVVFNSMTTNSGVVTNDNHVAMTTSATSAAAGVGVGSLVMAASIQVNPIKLLEYQCLDAMFDDFNDLINTDSSSSSHKPPPDVAPSSALSTHCPVTINSSNHNFSQPDLLKSNNNSAPMPTSLNGLLATGSLSGSGSGSLYSKSNGGGVVGPLNSGSSSGLINPSVVNSNHLLSLNNMHSKFLGSNPSHSNHLDFIQSSRQSSNVPCNQSNSLQMLPNNSNISNCNNNLSTNHSTHYHQHHHSNHQHHHQQQPQQPSQQHHSNSLTAPSNHDPNHPAVAMQQTPSVSGNHSRRGNNKQQNNSTATSVVVGNPVAMQHTHNSNPNSTATAAMANNNPSVNVVVPNNNNSSSSSQHQSISSNNTPTPMNGLIVNPQYYANQRNLLFQQQQQHQQHQQYMDYQQSMVAMPTNAGQPPSSVAAAAAYYDQQQQQHHHNHINSYRGNGIVDPAAYASMEMANRCHNNIHYQDTRLKMNYNQAYYSNNQMMGVCGPSSNMHPQSISIHPMSSTTQGSSSSTPNSTPNSTSSGQQQVGPPSSLTTAQYHHFFHRSNGAPGPASQEYLQQQQQQQQHHHHGINPEGYYSMQASQSSQLQQHYSQQQQHNHLMYMMQHNKTSQHNNLSSQQQTTTQSAYTNNMIRRPGQAPSLPQSNHSSGSVGSMSPVCPPPGPPPGASVMSYQHYPPPATTAASAGRPPEAPSSMSSSSGLLQPPAPPSVNTIPHPPSGSHLFDISPPQPPTATSPQAPSSPGLSSANNNICDNPSHSSNELKDSPHNAQTSTPLNQTSQSSPPHALDYEESSGTRNHTSHDNRADSAPDDANHQVVSAISDTQQTTGYTTSPVTSQSQSVVALSTSSPSTTLPSDDSSTNFSSSSPNHTLSQSSSAINSLNNNLTSTQPLQSQGLT